MKGNKTVGLMRVVKNSVLYCGKVRRLMPPDALQPKAYCTNPGVYRSYLHSQVSPPETLEVKGRTTWARNGRWSLPENARLPRTIQGSFTCRKSMTWDKRLYFPSEGRRAEDFFALKIPTASAGFEPAIMLPLDHRSRFKKSVSTKQSDV